MLSIIVTGRNDDYDGNFEERLSISLSRNTKSLPSAEFILVEWNPILEKPLVCEKLKKIFGDRIRYFVVHPKYHSQYCTCDWFIEYPAKNIGIRKAKGNFILCTNSDIIFSPEVVNNLKSQLNDNTIYRAIRIDIPVNHLDVSFPLLGKYKLAINGGLTNGCGDFLLLHRNMWLDVTGYCEEFPEQRLHKDSQIIYKLLDKCNYPVVNLGIITHWRHASSWANTLTRPRIGDPRWNFRECGYEKNKDTWGLTFTREENRNGITWLM